MNDKKSKLSLNDLERHLWEAAHIITGTIDASDYKTYIFPILFFKRVCDVYDEEFEEAMEFYGDAPWTNKERLPDHLLPQLLNHFNKIRIGVGHVRDPRLLKLKGQENNLTTEAIARMNLYLHGMEDFEIRRGDTLKDPEFLTYDHLELFDCVIANPPFSLKEWGHDKWSSDPFNRHVFGLAPKTNGDFAWVMHMYSSMKEDSGRMAVVLPHGVLFRSGAEAIVRKKLLELGAIEAVIRLAELEEALAFSDGDEEFAALPEQHRFIIPESARWDALRETSTNIGAFLYETPIKVLQSEELAPRLRPIFRCGQEPYHAPAMPVIRNAFPPQQHISEILRALDESNNGLSVPEMQRVLNLRKNQIDKTTKFLTVESPSPITYIKPKWHVTATATFYQVN